MTEEGRLATAAHRHLVEELAKCVQAGETKTTGARCDNTARARSLLDFGEVTHIGKCSETTVNITVVKMIVNSTQDLFSRVSSFFPSLRSFSRHSSDSGFQSGCASLPPSRPLSRRSSLFSLLSLGGSEAPSEGDDDEEFKSHVKVVPGGNVSDDYELLELLGEGAFSKVYLAESKSDKGGLAAVKVINKEELCREENKMFLIEKEIEIMSQLDHPNVVKLYEVYVNEEEVCLVMELAKGGEVFDRLLECGSLPELEAARLLHQVLDAVQYLHTRGIVHRDLKPENLLFYDNKSNSKVMVTDFGLSEYEEELSPESPVCGTATYLSPEVIKRTASTRAQDMWSLGVISYIILCGYPPFFRDKSDANETELLRQISKGKYKFHNNFWDDISIEAKDFVRQLMCVKPEQRMSVEEALNHPWIRSAMGHSFTDTFLQSVAQATAVLGSTAAVFYVYFTTLSYYFNVEYHFVSYLSGCFATNWALAVQNLGELADLPGKLWRNVDMDWLRSVLEDLKQHLGDQTSSGDLS